jgi:hypothetical protein
VLNKTTLILTGLLIACSGNSQQEESTTPPPVTKVKPPAEKQARTCDEKPGHRYEAIELPPEFAPSLPRGREELWFSPGMFKEEAPDYFTYTFSLRFDDVQAPAQIETILHDYFSGLMGAVAKGKGREHDSSATRVELRSLDAHLEANCRAEHCERDQTYYVATIETADEFTSGKAIKLHAYLEVSGSCVRVSVQPTARGTDLEIAQGISSELKPSWPCLRCDTNR